MQAIKAIFRCSLSSIGLIIKGERERGREGERERGREGERERGRALSLKNPFHITFFVLYFVLCSLFVCCYLYEGCNCHFIHYLTVQFRLVVMKFR